MNTNWDKIVEQNKIKKELDKIVKSGRVPHAFIFYGNDGVGKFNTAIEFIKNIVENNQVSKNHLEKYLELQEPYLKLIFPLPRGKNEQGDDLPLDKLPKDVITEIQEKIKLKSSNPFYPFQIEDANQIRINSIREIKKFSNLSNELYRFIIIIDAHLMNEQSQNALLKTLEEPPENIFIILLTSNIDSLLSTVKSRSRIFTFEPLSESSVKKILINNFSMEKNIAEKVSKFSFGSYTHALNLANFEIDKILELTIDFLRNAFTLNRYFSAYKILNTFVSDFGKEHIPFFINLLKLWMIDAVREKNGIKNFTFSNYKETFIKFNQKYPKASLETLIHKLDFLQNLYDRNLNLNVFYLNIIFELNSVIKRL